MKILQINAVYEYSSTGRNVQEMHEFYISKGHESYVAAKNVKSFGNFIKIGNNFDYKIHAFFSRLTGLQGHYSFFSTKILIAKIKKIKPDIIHLHNLHSNYINYPILLKFIRKYDIPTVITLHDCWPFTGHCCYFIDSNCCKWQNKCGHCPDLHRWNKSWFFDKTAKQLEEKKMLFSNIPHLAVIGVSDWVTSFVKSSILRNAEIVRRIYNWIDTDLFSPKDVTQLRLRLTLNDEFVVLGIAQRWTEQKGINEFIKLASICNDIKFVLVGLIPKEYNRFILPNMICVGSINNVHDLVQYYSLGDVFFNPSSRETFGKVTVEALACGTPVIGYDTTATPELIKSKCGYVVSKNNLSQVVECIKKIKLRGKTYYTQNCVRFAKSEFSSEVLLEQHLKIYQDILKNK